MKRCDRADVPDRRGSSRSSVARHPARLAVPRKSCAARIVFDARSFESSGFAETRGCSRPRSSRRARPLGRVDVAVHEADAATRTRVRSSRRSASSSTRSRSGSAIAAQQRQRASASERSGSAPRAQAIQRAPSRGVAGDPRLSARRTDRRCFCADRAARWSTTSAGAASREARRLLRRGAGRDEEPDAAAGRQPPRPSASEPRTSVGLDRARRSASPPSNFERATRSSPRPEVDPGGSSPLPRRRRSSEPDSVARPRSPRPSTRFAAHSARSRASCRWRCSIGLRVALIAPLLHRPARLRQRSPSAIVDVGDFDDLVDAPDLAAAEPRQARRQERRAVPRDADHREASPEYAGRARRTSRCRGPGTSPPTAHRFHPATTISRMSTTGSTPSPTRSGSDYPHIVQIFKNSPFPPEIVKGLSVALDDLGDRPLIVRSSSLLEDRFGRRVLRQVQEPLPRQPAAPSAERLAALHGRDRRGLRLGLRPRPDRVPRASAGSSTCTRRWAIMIQEVVGTRVGHYFLPAFSGVAFSRQRVSLVAAHPARGRPPPARARASARAPSIGSGDDYPVLMAPGQPGLARQRHAGRSRSLLAEEDRRHRSRERRSFETVRGPDLLRERGDRDCRSSRSSSRSSTADRLRRPRET